MDSTLFSCEHTHPYEKEVCALTKQIFKDNQWPFERLSVSVQFGLWVSLASKHDINFRLNQGTLIGECVIYYNYLYLIQKPKLFFTEVIPHEIAHILSKAEAIKREKSIELHGNEWKRWVIKINPNMSPKANWSAGTFDDRPLRLFKGGVPFRCECDIEHAVDIFINNNTEKAAAKVCSRCNHGFVKASYDDIPKIVIEAKEYIKNEQSKRG